MPLVLSGEGAVSVRPSEYAQVRETISLVQRQIDDLSWTNLANDDIDQSINDNWDARETAIKRSRVAARRSPLAITSVKLLKHYVLGMGMTAKASNRALIARVVDEFMHHPVNEMSMTSHEAMKEMLEAAYVDGDLFLVLFVDKELGTVQVGTLDALLVTDIIYDAENSKVPLWYKVKKTSRKYDFTADSWEAPDNTGDVVYYRHWRNGDDRPGDPPPSKVAKGLVYQASVDKRGKFGRPQLAAALDWLNSHREFMENRATINRAAAAVAWKKKRKGPASDIAAEAVRMQSSLVTNPTRFDSNPARAAGATVVENEGSSLDWVKTDTGGSAADYDERKLRMMAGSAMGGIPNHYFGDEGNANLATATAMELPLLKAYENWQQWLRDIFTDLVDFALSVAFEAKRIGPRDDSSRYAERSTTPQAVMDMPKSTDNTPIPTSGATTPGTAGVAEALATVPFNDAPAVRLKMMPAAAVGGDVAKTIRIGNRGDEEPDKTKPVDWYVDFDFPPIVQKQMDAYMNAVKVLAELLPTENIESKKMSVELALAAFGVNDLDQVMSRLYPPDMVAVLAPVPQPPQFGQPPMMAGPQPAAKPVGPPDLDFLAAQASGAPVTESIAEYRRRRILRAAAEVVDAYGYPVEG
jgi:hypothetical protein